MGDIRIGCAVIVMLLMLLMLSIVTHAVHYEFEEKERRIANKKEIINTLQSLNQSRLQNVSIKFVNSTMMSYRGWFDPWDIRGGSGGLITINMFRIAPDNPAYSRDPNNLRGILIHEISHINCWQHSRRAILTLIHEGDFYDCWISERKYHQKKETLLIPKPIIPKIQFSSQYMMKFFGVSRN